MLSERDEYRRRAAACRAEAQKATDPDQKRRFEQLAVGWETLAGGAEQRELLQQKLGADE